MFFNKNKDKKIIAKQKDKIIDYTKKVTSFDNVAENFNDIKDLYSSLAIPKKNSNEQTKKFEDFVIQNKLTTLDLSQMYFNYSINFFISFVFGIICLIMAVYLAIVKLSFLPFLASISIFLICLTNAFRFSFWAFRIKHKKLCSVSDWWQSSEQWIPKFKL